MREIEFRAWDSKNNKYEEALIISFFDKFSWAHGQSYIHNSEEWYGEEGFVNKPILEQYTGLKDKNGKKIFEGDIVRTLSDVELIYGKESDVFKRSNKDGNLSGWFKEVKWRESNYMHGYEFSPGGCEVVGNIHMNQELLIQINDQSNASYLGKS